MRWPFVSRRRCDELTARVAFLEQSVSFWCDVKDAAQKGTLEAQEREKYWRERFEKLVDATLLKSGAVNAPVMESEHAQRARTLGPFAGMALNEVPTDKRKTG